MKCDISASIMCANLLHLERDLYALRDNGVAYLHCDVMDGHYAPDRQFYKIGGAVFAPPQF